MSDDRFFVRSEPITLQDIANISGARLENCDDATLSVHDVSSLDKADSECVTFLDNPKYKDLLPHSKAKACFLREKYKELAPKGMALFVSDDPYRSYALTAQAFYPVTKNVSVGTVHPSAIIHPTAKVGGNASIAAGAVIEEDVILDENVSVGIHSVIHRGVKIGKNTHIAAQACVSHAEIGEHVIIHRGVKIGQDGFGFAMGAGGHVKVPQLGRVIIRDHVEIGANACIDRGAGPDTVIGLGAKIDNLVQIGHNVQVGAHAVIVAQTGVAGSSHVGDYAILAGQVGVAGHLTIGAGAKIAAQSGVTQNVEAGASMGGYPAVRITEWHRQAITLARLTKRKKKT